MMQLVELTEAFNVLQKRFGDSGLRSIYGAGCIHEPDICFVFMNPTGRNVSANPAWPGLRAPWIGTRNVWTLFARLKLISNDLYEGIRAKRPGDWSPDFASRVYKAIAKQKLYITNLSKSTQQDARHLPDAVFREYLPLLHQEILTIRPKCIVAFGNQVSSILLGRPIKVSEARKAPEALSIRGTKFSVYPTYYPVGQGMRNSGKAVEDIQHVMETI